MPIIPDSNYPGAVDDYQALNASEVQPLLKNKSLHMRRSLAGVTAIEYTLGVNPQGGDPDVATRLNGLTGLFVQKAGDTMQGSLEMQGTSRIGIQTAGAPQARLHLGQLSSGTVDGTAVILGSVLAAGDVGPLSAVFGTNNSAAGARSAVFGQSSNVLANDSVSFGAGNNVNGVFSMALGTGNTVQVGAFSSSAFGSGNTINAGASQGTAFGSGNIVGSGGQNFAAGSGNTIQDGAGIATVFGSGNIINPSGQATAFGSGNTVLSSGVAFAAGVGNTVGLSTGGAVFGTNNQNYANFAFCEGQNNILSSGGVAGHIEGSNNSVTSVNGHAEGQFNTVSDVNGHAEGQTNFATGAASHAEGSGNTASGGAAHAEGSGTLADSGSSHAEGGNTQATNTYAHAEGFFSLASGSGSHAEGQSTASNTLAHSEGYLSVASGFAAHAEGQSTLASAMPSHAEGLSTMAVNVAAHAEGFNTTSSGLAAHAEGTSTQATNTAAHAEGNNSIASGGAAHAEGANGTASGDASHSQNNACIALGHYSHAGGVQSESNADVSLAHGYKARVALGHSGSQVSTDGIAGFFTSSDSANQRKLRFQNGWKLVRGGGADDVDGPEYGLQQATVGTVDATVTALQDIAIPTDSAVLLEARVVARRTGGAMGTPGDGATYVVRARFKNDAGTVTAHDVQQDFVSEDQAAWDATWVVNGTNAELQVVGAVDNNVTWTTTTTVQRVF